MFILNETHEYDWPVDVEVPQNGGAHLRQRFTARFRVLAKDRAEAMFLDGADDALLAEVLVGWNADEVRVGTPQGGEAPLPFTPENRDRLLRNPYVRAAVLRAYGDSISGRKPKN